MKKYNITVNGNTYEVLVEEAGVVSAPVTYSAPVATPAPAPVAAPAAPKAAPAAPKAEPVAEKAPAKEAPKKSSDALDLDDLLGDLF